VGAAAFRGVGSLEGDVFGRVPGCGDDFEADTADVDCVARFEGAVVEGKAADGASADGAAGAGSQLAAAGDEVVVEVGLQGVGNFHAQGVGLADIEVHVAGGVDDGAELRVLGADDVGGVAEAFDANLLDQHGRLLGKRRLHG
jgi:hypothetical protein